MIVRILLILFILQIVGSFFSTIIILRNVIAQRDYDTTLNVIMTKINQHFNLGANYIFNNNKTYPPIENDCTFWIMSADSKNYTKIHLNDDDNDDQFMSSKFVPNRPIGILIHGWVDSFNHPLSKPSFKGWMKTTAEAWSKYNNQTVICVDWNRLANYPYMISGQKHTKMIGKYLGKFIKNLNRKYGVDYDDITIVGHSLGGQIAGLTGAYLKGKLGQIIALDPAGPMFTIPKDIGIANRLDSTDAQFIQSIYTSCGTFGTHINSGHANYFVNGGIIQPQCMGPDVFVSSPDAPEPIICSHIQAIEIFRSSCNPDNQYEGYECLNEPSQCNFLNSRLKGNRNPFIRMLMMFMPTAQTNNNNNNNKEKKCTIIKKDLFGIYTKRIAGDFYLDTDGNDP